MDRQDAQVLVARVHGAIGIAGVFLLTWWARGQWFRDDDWAVLVQHVADGWDGLLRPHVDHLIAVPVAMLDLLFTVFGARTYVPYVLLTIAASNGP